ncbi:hypothetical protein GCM10010971_06730 [Silvimonas amylolytica]|uniref:Uncharacterized protein n=2 Tax=Silvimonas amylolytica TaxID=449663 RepID=A0ABQ2PIP7_9NEIS|nr:hypothetical protein GCM10010971_06730 [Silvimonas amylolytica]
MKEPGFNERNRQIPVMIAQQKTGFPGLKPINNVWPHTLAPAMAGYFRWLVEDALIAQSGWPTAIQSLLKYAYAIF